MLGASALASRWLDSQFTSICQVWQIFRVVNELLRTLLLVVVGTLQPALTLLLELPPLRPRMVLLQAVVLVIRTKTCYPMNLMTMSPRRKMRMTWWIA
jgi:hypothetical protein